MKSVFQNLNLNSFLKKYYYVFDNILLIAE